MHKSYKKYENIHHLLAHSHVMYFVLLLVGVTLDTIFKLRIFQHPAIAPIGFILLAIATGVIIWTEMTAWDLRKHKKEDIKKETFCRGPYCYTRSPLHWGLFLLMLGFGIIANAFFVVLTTVISFLIAKFVFQEKEEKILEAKYGQPYLEYKKEVKL